MEWKLKKVGPIEHTLDDSGIYIIVIRRERTETHKEYAGKRVTIRVDIMDGTAIFPIFSFEGAANDVRKHVVNWIQKEIPSPISFEHASYIGYEIARANTDSKYVQN